MDFSEPPTAALGEQCDVEPQIARRGADGCADIPAERHLGRSYGEATVREVMARRDVLLRNRAEETIDRRLRRGEVDVGRCPSIDP